MCTLWPFPVANSCALQVGYCALQVGCQAAKLQATHHTIERAYFVGRILYIGPQSVPFSIVWCTVYACCTKPCMGSPGEFTLTAKVTPCSSQPLKFLLHSTHLQQFPELPNPWATSIITSNFQIQDLPSKGVVWEKALWQNFYSVHGTS